MQKLISSLDKGELHVHLNGLIPVETIRSILINETVKVPQGFNLDKDLLRESPMNCLEDYLKPWEVLRLIPNSRESLKIIMQSAFANLKQQNIKFVEIRNSIIYLSFLNNISVETALQWFLEEMEVASEKYEIKAGLILTISRGDYCKENFHALIQAYENIGRPKLVVGLDLAGNEDIKVDDTTGSLFKSAKDEFGLGITIHAGETGCTQNIIKAIDLFGADRIGHGTAAGLNKDVMKYIRENDVCVEVCPISNRLTGAVRDSDYHPVVEFVENDVPFVICSDNPAIHNKTLNDDYFAFYAETKRKDILESMLDRQSKYSFIKGLN